MSRYVPLVQGITIAPLQLRRARYSRRRDHHRPLCDSMFFRGVCRFLKFPPTSTVLSLTLGPFLFSGSSLCPRFFLQPSEPLSLSLISSSLTVRTLSPAVFPSSSYFNLPGQFPFPSPTFLLSTPALLPVLSLFFRIQRAFVPRQSSSALLRLKRTPPRGDRHDRIVGDFRPGSFGNLIINYKEGRVCSRDGQSSARERKRCRSKVAFSTWQGV